MFCALLLAAAIARGCLAVLKKAARAGEDAPMQIGLAGFLAANAASFLISHQVYGDPLVLILTAFVLGVVLSSSRWSQAVVVPIAWSSRVPSGRAAG